MEEETIKSAFEIAMERISGLPELTPEEIAAQKQKQYGPVGEAIAGRYLEGVINEDELSVEVGKQPAECRQIVRRALAAALCRAIQLERDVGESRKALHGMIWMAPGHGDAIWKAENDLLSVLRDFEQEKMKKSAGIEVSALQALGISGTAVRCNPAENAHWQAALENMRRSYEPRLEAIRDALMRQVQNS